MLKKKQLLRRIIACVIVLFTMILVLLTGILIINNQIAKEVIGNKIPPGYINIFSYKSPKEENNVFDWDSHYVTLINYDNKHTVVLINGPPCVDLKKVAETAKKYGKAEDVVKDNNVTENYLCKDEELQRIYDGYEPAGTVMVNGKEYKMYNVKDQDNNKGIIVIFNLPHRNLFFYCVSKEDDFDPEIAKSFIKHLDL